MLIQFFHNILKVIYRPSGRLKFFSTTLPNISCGIPAMVSSIVSFRATRVQGWTLYCSDLTYPHRKSHMESNGRSDRAMEHLPTKKSGDRVRVFSTFRVNDGHFGPWLHVVETRRLLIYHAPRHTLPFWEFSCIASRSHGNSWSCRFKEIRPTVAYTEGAVHQILTLWLWRDL